MLLSDSDFFARVCPVLPEPKSIALPAAQHVCGSRESDASRGSFVPVLVERLPCTVSLAFLLMQFSRQRESDRTQFYHLTPNEARSQSHPSQKLTWQLKVTGISPLRPKNNCLLLFHHAGEAEVISESSKGKHTRKPAEVQHPQAHRAEVSVVESSAIAARNFAQSLSTTESTTGCEL